MLDKIIGLLFFVAIAILTLLLPGDEGEPPRRFME